MGTRHIFLALALSLAGSWPILADEPDGDQPTQSSLHWLPYRHAASPDNSPNNSPDWKVRSVAFDDPPARPSAGADAAIAPSADSPKARPAIDPVPESIDAPSRQPVRRPVRVQDDPPEMVGGEPDDGIDGVGCDEPCGPPCGRCCCQFPRPAAPYWVNVDVPDVVDPGDGDASASDHRANRQSQQQLRERRAWQSRHGRPLRGRQDSRSDAARRAFTARPWLNPCGTVAIEGEYLALGGAAVHFSDWSSGDPILGRPFYNVVANQQYAEEVAYPGDIAGSVSVDARTSFAAAGADLRIFLAGCERCCSSPCDPNSAVRRGWRADLLLGYRYLQLSDRLGIGEELTTASASVSSASFDIHDEFDTKNQFNGGVIGLAIAIDRGRWSFLMTPKIALGSTYEVANIDGRTLTTAPYTGTDGNTYLHTDYARGGLLTAVTNIGNHSQDVFAVAPEFNGTLAYQLTPRLQATFGYSFLYVSRVLRAGDQIDFNVNPNLAFGGTGPAGGNFNHPAFAFNQTGFWAQGLNFGLNYSW